MVRINELDGDCRYLLYWVLACFVNSRRVIFVCASALRESPQADTQMLKTTCMVSEATPVNGVEEVHCACTRLYNDLSPELVTTHNRYVLIVEGTNTR